MSWGYRLDATRVPYQLKYNGADNPDRWRPDQANVRDAGPTGVPEEGDLIGWRYGVWEVISVYDIPEHEMSDTDRAELNKFVTSFKPEARPKRFMKARPRKLVVRHESGPLLAEGFHPRRAEDGTVTVHMGTNVACEYVWQILTDPYRVCSCHGEIWPCQEMDRTQMARYNAQVMDKAMATTVPGICAACLEPISTRQRSITFPDESRFVPGAPGPTFHAGRAECWAAAEQYDLARIADNPEATRHASCPGRRYLHDAQTMAVELRVDCSAGPACTGLHGPAGFRNDLPCWFNAGDDGYGPGDPPSRDCGYRSTSADRGPCRGQFRTLITI